MASFDTTRAPRIAREDSAKTELSVLIAVGEVEHDRTVIRQLFLGRQRSTGRNRPARGCAANSGDDRLGAGADLAERARYDEVIEQGALALVVLGARM